MAATAGQRVRRSVFDSTICYRPDFPHVYRSRPFQTGSSRSHTHAYFACLISLSNFQRPSGSCSSLRAPGGKRGSREETRQRRIRIRRRRVFRLPVHSLILLYWAVTAWEGKDHHAQNRCAWPPHSPLLAPLHNAVPLSLLILMFLVLACQHPSEFYFFSSPSLASRARTIQS